MIRIWHSYSCNNSSSYRLVARFDTPQAAAAVAAELREFFPKHIVELERQESTEELSESQLAIGTKYGFTWTEALYWDGAPEVFTCHEVMIVLHTYCNGFGDLTDLLTKLGALEATEQHGDTVDVSLLFRAAPGDHPALDAELAAFFQQLAEHKTARDGELVAPWAEYRSAGTAAWFRDSDTVGLYLPTDPRDLAALERWLADHHIDKPSLQVEQQDLPEFDAIASATCRSCNGGLDYLDPRIHDIETPQLVCRACGGLYDLKVFVS